MNVSRKINASKASLAYSFSFDPTIIYDYLIVHFRAVFFKPWAKESVK